MTHNKRNRSPLLVKEPPSTRIGKLSLPSYALDKLRHRQIPLQGSLNQAVSRFREKHRALLWGSYCFQDLGQRFTIHGSVRSKLFPLQESPRDVPLLNLKLVVCTHLQEQLTSRTVHGRATCWPVFIHGIHVPKNHGTGLRTKRIPRRIPFQWFDSFLRIIIKFPRQDGHETVSGELARP